MMYECKFFKLHELVPVWVYNRRDINGWQLLDDRLLRTLDLLRGRYGPITVNDYYWGGLREWSGLRTYSQQPAFSHFSQHTFGRAADCLFHNITVEEVRNDIIDSPDFYRFEHIKGLELNVSWLHIDVRNSDKLITFTK